MNRKKIVLIGAGSAVFTQGLVADFIMAKGFGLWEIALVDINEQALHSITTLTNKMVKEKNADIVITSSSNRRDVLPDADVVITTIAVGGRRAWENDVIIPRKYGIYQPVGDTTMPGGISRALRMIPVMIDISKDIKELCPDAHFINYSNPMTAICQAIQKVTGVNVTGLCHGVIHVEQYLAKFINAKNSEVKSLGVGINHLTFLYDLRINGKNAWPIIDQELYRQKKMEPGSSLGKEEKILYENSYKNNQFSWSFYERYGVFPAVLDRHVTEFFPEHFPNGKYYGKVLGKEVFSLESVIAEGDKIYEEMHEQAQGRLPLDEKSFKRTEGEHEQLVEILRSIYNDERKIFSVNLPNEGAVPNLPAHAVLELPAVATGMGLIPLHINDFPDELALILRKRIHVVDLTVEAALTGKKSLLVEAMVADGAVDSKEMANSLAEELLITNKQYLPQFN
ncbi:hypothetical protein [Lederbergia citrea]|uniref:family 4 glycosyl hydrolase n=1 Tax=Lederbergia citrea TaxID=2833581 RepID=UPI001BCA64BB|nr:hypothetical protein [Lederbergia citrea]